MANLLNIKAPSQLTEDELTSFLAEIPEGAVCTETRRNGRHTLTQFEYVYDVTDPSGYTEIYTWCVDITVDGVEISYSYSNTDSE
jgi:hypothetical protein